MLSLPDQATPTPGADHTAAVFRHAVERYREALTHMLEVQAFEASTPEEVIKHLNQGIELSDFACTGFNDARDHLIDLLMALTTTDPRRYIWRLDEGDEPAGPPRVVILDGFAYIASVDESDWDEFEQGQPVKPAGRTLQIVPTATFRDLGSEHAPNGQALTRSTASPKNWRSSR